MSKNVIISRRQETDKDSTTKKIKKKYTENCW